LFGGFLPFAVAANQVDQAFIRLALRHRFFDHYLAYIEVDVAW
jgi:hypothetical protein